MPVVTSFPPFSILKTSGKPEKFSTLWQPIVVALTCMLTSGSPHIDTNLSSVFVIAVKQNNKNHNAFASVVFFFNPLHLMCVSFWVDCVISLFPGELAVLFSVSVAHWLACGSLHFVLVYSVFCWCISCLCPSRAWCKTVDAIWSRCPPPDFRIRIVLTAIASTEFNRGFKCWRQEIWGP